MPLFEYICRNCSRKFEQLVGGSFTPACPFCQSRSLEKQISVFAVGGSGGANGDADGELADSSPDAGGACGSCGDPRGPGSCDLD